MVYIDELASQVVEQAALRIVWYQYQNSFTNIVLPVGRIPVSSAQNLSHELQHKLNVPEIWNVYKSEGNCQ